MLSEMVSFNSNLDGVSPFTDRLTSNWPPSCIPRKGDLIRFSLDKMEDGKFREVHFELEVYSVTHELSVNANRSDLKRLYHHIYLGIPSYQNNMNVAEWYEWFRKYRD